MSIKTENKIFPFRVHVTILNYLVIIRTFLLERNYHLKLNNLPYSDDQELIILCV